MFFGPPSCLLTSTPGSRNSFAYSTSTACTKASSSSLSSASTSRGGVLPESEKYRWGQESTSTVRTTFVCLGSSMAFYLCFGDRKVLRVRTYSFCVSRSICVSGSSTPLRKHTVCHFFGVKHGILCCSPSMSCHSVPKCTCSFGLNIDTRKTVLE